MLADAAAPRIAVQGSLIDVRISRRSDRFDGVFGLGWLAFGAVLLFAVNNGVLWHISRRPFNEMRIIVYGRQGAYVIDAVIIVFVILQVAESIWDWLQ